MRLSVADLHSAGTVLLSSLWITIELRGRRRTPPLVLRHAQLPSGAWDDGLRRRRSTITDALALLFEETQTFQWRFDVLPHEALTYMYREQGLHLLLRRTLQLAGGAARTARLHHHRQLHITTAMANEQEAPSGPTSG